MNQFATKCWGKQGRRGKWGIRKRGTQFVDPAPASTSEREGSIGTSDILHHDALFTCHQREEGRERKREGESGGECSRESEGEAAKVKTFEWKWKWEGESERVREEAEEAAYNANRCVAWCHIRRRAGRRSSSSNWRRCLHPQTCHQLRLLAFHLGNASPSMQLPLSLPSPPTNEFGGKFCTWIDLSPATAIESKATLGASWHWGVGRGMVSRVGGCHFLLLPLQT